METVDGRSFRVHEIVENELLKNIAVTENPREDELAWVESFGSPYDRLLSGDAGPSSEFDLRHRTLAMRNEP